MSGMNVVETVQRAMLGAHQWLYEHTDGRFGHKIGKLPALLLRTTGARTGKTRTSALVYATDGDDRYVVVGSNGGAERAPGRGHNLRAVPHAEVPLGRTPHLASAEML